MRKILLFGLLISLFVLTGVSAISVNSVDVKTFKPGETGTIKIDIENVFDETVKNLVLDIDVTNSPLNVVGSSSFGVNELQENDNEIFAFSVRVSPTAKPGEYQIPYVLTYSIGSVQSTRKGSIGVKITSDAIVDFSAHASVPVVGEKSKLDFNIINNGLGDLSFVSVKLIPDGFTLFSEEQLHIGTVASDDFEVASFDVLFTRQDVSAKALVEYRDSENKLVRENIELPLTVYSREKALGLGIIKKNNTVIYVFAAVGLIVLWIVIRAIRKRRRLKKSQGG